MPSNFKHQSVANTQACSDASKKASTSNATKYAKRRKIKNERNPCSSHPPSNPKSCTPTNPQSSAKTAEKYCSIAQSWPSRKTTLGNRLHVLFNNEIGSDVTFLVGKGAQQQRIPAHKPILSAGSAVFHAMFNGPLATTSLEIEVLDVEPTAFLAVLLFLYTDQFCGDPETVMMTLYAAKKYAVEQVVESCVQFLRSNLSSSNAFMLLTQARFFNEPELSSVCLNEIDKSTAMALNADGFRDIDIDTLMHVLGRETLRVDESKLFEAVVRWSEAECARQQLPVIPENQRIVLGKALYLVRFPLMSLEKFAAGPVQSGILTDREIISLYQYFTLNPRPAVDFEVTPRIGMQVKRLIARRFQKNCFSTPQSLNSIDDVMSFTVDKRIFIIGFGVYGRKASTSEIKNEPTVYINLTRRSCGNVIASSYQQDFKSYYESANIYAVTFAGPVEIEANTEYAAVAHFQCPVSRYGFQDLKRVTVNCSLTKEKVTFQFSSPINRGISSDHGYMTDIIFFI